MILVVNDDYVKHYGVKGQKWGERREKKRAVKNSTQFNNRRAVSVAVGVGAAFTARKLGGQNILMSAAIGKVSSLVTHALIKTHQHKKVSEIRP